MNVYLKLDSIKNEKLIFKFKFINTDLNPRVLPVSEFESSVDSDGLKIVNNEQRIEPVKYMMISLSNPRDGDVVLKNGDEYEISIAAVIENTSNLGYILKFKHATYLLDAGITYQINLSWRGFLSNVVKWTFNPLLL